MIICKYKIADILEKQLCYLYQLKFSKLLLKTTESNYYSRQFLLNNINIISLLKGILFQF